MQNNQFAPVTLCLLHSRLPYKNRYSIVSAWGGTIKQNIQSDPWMVSNAVILGGVIPQEGSGVQNCSDAW
jgi:hypothetical protein